ncbi:MAG TPA: hypothetical protein VMN82_12375 [Thermoanaerobaculia bacterium]|nr:hypothetical protein [Thermoanaerobaculia bacterium]
MRTAVRVLAVVLLLAVLVPAIAAACPLCKDATSNSDKPGQSSVWRGMYWSILLMVAAPFTMVGGMIVAIRRARRRLDAGLPPSPAPLRFPETPGAHT